MNAYVKNFFLRGLIFGGFGPIVMAIVYFVLSLTLEDFTLSGGEIAVATLSTYLLAFIHAGASVFNQIEHWPPIKSIPIHFAFLYLAYTGCYLVNSWIPFDPMVLIIFTAIFLLAYFIIWLTVFISVKAASKRLNEKIK